MSESGRLGGTMYQRAARTRPIIRLQSKTRGAWMNGMGYSYSSVTFERSFAPLTGDPWETIAASDGSTSACRPPTDTVSFGQTSRTVAPRHYAINTEMFCIRDIQFGWQYAQWMQKVSKALDFIPQWVWARRFTEDYVTNGGHKVTLNQTAGFQDDPTTFNTSNIANGRLTQDHLNYIYMDLYREGADQSTATDTDTNEPIFTLITSSETSKALLFDNPELRTDMRYATMGKGPDGLLSAGMPTKRRQYGGFIHDIDPYPRRFNFAGGAYVEVAPWISSSTTKGNKWEQNPAYKTAPIEESIIWHEANYRDLAVNTAENTPPDWNFTPQSWMGSFSVRNILERNCNPDGTEIFFRALFASADEPINPAVGWAVRHARCGISTSARSCYVS